MLLLRRVYIILLTLILFAATQPDMLGQSRFLFRYNADYALNSDLQSDVVLNEIVVETRAEAAEQIARGVGGWGYLSRKTALFNADSSYILTATHPALSLFGSIELSGEFWIKPFTADGVLLSWDDSTKIHGFNLFLQDGKVNLRSRISNDIYELAAPTALNLVQWHHIQWTCEVRNDSVTQAIYINRREAVRQKEALLSGFGFVVLNAPVSLGFSFGNNLPVTAFSGEIYAANLKGYLPKDIYLTSPPPTDGSAYFGIANYHDYPIGSSEANIDLRITENPTAVDFTIFVPFLNDNFIPQGITNSFEDETFSEPEGIIYISMYNKTPSGQTQLKRSIIVEIDPQNDYRVRRCFRLWGSLQFGHNGGIAYKNNAIYVATANKVEVYDLPAYQSGDEKYQDLFPRSGGLFSVQSKASFVTYFQDSLWAGDYRTSTQQTPFLFGYPLDAQGNVINSAAPKIYRLPFQSQGVAWRIYNGKKYLFISRSGGDNGSFIYRCPADSLSQFDEPVIDTVLNVAAGGEDLSFNNLGQLLNVSESGTKFFQKKPSPWTTFYPFIYAIPEAVLFGDVITGISEQITHSSPKNAPGGFLLLPAFPNPFNSEITISYSLKKTASLNLRIYDSLGQEVQILDTTRHQPGEYRVKWDATAFPSGLYFISASINGAHRQTEKIILIK